MAEAESKQSSPFQHQTSIESLFVETKKLVKQGLFKKSFQVLDRFYNHNCKQNQMNDIDMLKLCRRILFSILKILGAYKVDGQLSKKKQSIQLLGRAYTIIGTWRRIILDILSTSQKYEEQESQENQNNQNSHAEDKSTFISREQSIDLDNLSSQSASPINVLQFINPDEIVNQGESFADLFNISNNIVGFLELDAIPKKNSNTQIAFLYLMNLEKILAMPQLTQSTNPKSLEVCYEIQMFYANLLFQTEAFERCKEEAHRAYDIAVRMINVQFNFENQQKKGVDKQADISEQKVNKKRQDRNVKYLVTTLILLSSVYEQLLNIEKHFETIHLIQWLIRIFLFDSPEMNHLIQNINATLKEKYGQYLQETGEVNQVIQQMFKAERDQILNQQNVDDQDDGEGYSSRRTHLEKLNSYLYDKFSHKELNACQCIFIKRKVQENENKSKTQENETKSNDGKKQILIENSRQRDSIFFNQEMNSYSNAFDEQSTAFMSKKDSVVNQNTTEDDQTTSSIKNKSNFQQYFLNSYDNSLSNRRYSQSNDHIYVEQQSVLTQSLQNSSAFIRNNSSVNNIKYSPRKANLQQRTPKSSLKKLTTSPYRLKSATADKKDVILKPKLLSKSKYFPETVTTEGDKPNKSLHHHSSTLNKIEDKEFDIYELFSLKKPQSQYSQIVKDLEHFTGKLISQSIAKVQSFDPLSKVIEKMDKELQESTFDKKEFGFCRRFIDLKRVYGNGTTLEDDKDKNEKEVHMLEGSHKLEIEVNREAYLHNNHIYAMKQIEEAKESQKNLLKERQYQMYMKNKPKHIKSTLVNHLKELGLNNLRQQHKRENKKYSQNVSQGEGYHQSGEEQSKKMKQVQQLNEKIIKDYIDVAEKEGNVSVFQMKQQAKQEVKEQSALPNFDVRPKIPTHIVPIELDQNVERVRVSAKNYHSRIIENNKLLANSTQHINLANQAKYASSLGDLFSIKMKINKIEQAKKNIQKVNGVKSTILSNLKNFAFSTKAIKSDLIKQNYA